MFVRSVFVVALAVATSSTFAQYPGSKGVPSAWSKGFRSIRQEDAKEILEFLAGPTFGGRNAFNGDFFAAAGYIADQLRRLGLQPGGDRGSYLRRFTFTESTIVPGETELRSQDGQLVYKYGADFSLRSTETGDVDFKFAFLHAPIASDAGKLDWSLLKDRWVVLSSETLRNPLVMEILARRHPQITLPQPVRILDLNPGPESGRTQTVKNQPDPRVARFGNARLSSRTAQAIAEKLGATKFLAKSASEPSIEVSDVGFTLKVKATQRDQQATNVVGVLPGVDPALKDECVLIGSHLDHFGPSSDGVRFGADDNASGCTANLLLAKAILENRTKPKRSIVFAFWTLEESGTHGSYAYSAQPLFPLDKTVAYVNMDMLGRNEQSGVDIPENNVRAVYPGIVALNSPDFEKLLVRMNQYVNLRLKNDKEDRTERSDTRNFVWRGVPTVKIFTGEHRDYHRATDTVDKINFEKLTQITKWLYLTVQELAASPERPKFERKAWTTPLDSSYQGYVKLPEVLKVPKGAKLTVELVEIRDGTTPKTLASSTQNVIGASIPFEITVPRSTLDPKRTYELRFRVTPDHLAQSSMVAVGATGWLRPQDVTLKMVEKP